MKKLMLIAIICFLSFTACATQKAVDVDYEGQRDRASEGFRDLEKQ
jgi:hypothetical protein